MALGREAAEWGRLSVHLAEMWNTVRSSKTKAFKPSQFNPFDSRGNLKRSETTSSSNFARDMRALFPNLKGNPDA